MTYVVLDLETSMREQGPKGKSDPFFDKILTIGLKYKDRVETFAQDYMPSNWLDNINTIILHNSAFDLQFIWRNDELQDFFKRGGRIWDTQLTEYILSGQRHKYPALRDIAVNRYACNERVKHIEGRNTEEVSIELLLEDVRNDVMDTEAIALAQTKIAKTEGMMGLIQTQMDARLCTIEMEMNGFRVDMDVLNNNQKELEDNLLPIMTEIKTLAAKYWPLELREFNPGSSDQVGKLLFGGEYVIHEKHPVGLYKNGNVKYRSFPMLKQIEGLGLKAHKDWLTPGGKVSVNERVLKAINK